MGDTVNLFRVPWLRRGRWPGSVLEGRGRCLQGCAMCCLAQCGLGPCSYYYPQPSARSEPGRRGGLHRIQGYTLVNCFLCIVITVTLALHDSIVPLLGHACQQEECRGSQKTCSSSYHRVRESTRHCPTGHRTPSSRMYTSDLEARGMWWHVSLLWETGCDIAFMLSSISTAWFGIPTMRGYVNHELFQLQGPVGLAASARAVRLPAAPQEKADCYAGKGSLWRCELASTCAGGMVERRDVEPKGLRRSTPPVSKRAACCRQQRASDCDCGLATE
ncbi:hypothetical protein IF1G_06185 [Cordyceps javanica]|uniref:Uncharacterized protein n=1 Tax=Cordyceps javanica TaxID=43265 RepID=A0A545V0F1_9HYPO|nr:hypothetical protein IF1G_06185 [Cordyceps javanica]